MSNEMKDWLRDTQVDELLAKVEEKDQELLRLREALEEIRDFRAPYTHPLDMKNIATKALQEKEVISCGCLKTKWGKDDIGKECFTCGTPIKED